MTAKLFEGRFFVFRRKKHYRSFHLSCGSSLSGQHQRNLGAKKKKTDPPGRRKATNFSKFHFPPPENCSSQFLFPFDPTQRNSCVDPDLPRTRKERSKEKNNFPGTYLLFPFDALRTRDFQKVNSRKALLQKAAKRFSNRKEEL